jgi:hypothetical protein
VFAGPRELREPLKPLPEPGRAELPPPPYEDVPLISQQIPEARAFIDAYRAVGQPRIAVFVNRTLEGEVIPANNAEPFRGRFEARGPGYRETTEIYLKPGEYDEIAAKSIDYAAIEAKLAEWLSAGGAAKIVSASTIRQRLTDEEMSRLQQGRPRQLSEVSKNLDADVLVQVQARPTRQTPAGLEVRLIAEAVNIGPVATGEAVGHALVLVPPPLDSETINRYTRFIARKLMSDMTNAWLSPGPGGPGGAGGPAGQGAGPGQPGQPGQAAPGGDDRGPARPPTGPGPTEPTGPTGPARDVPGAAPGAVPGTGPNPGAGGGSGAATPVSPTAPVPDQPPASSTPPGPPPGPPPERPGSLLERRNVPPEAPAPEAPEASRPSGSPSVPAGK